MFHIIRRFTPQVEEYSIDEAFADVTGMRRALRSSYEGIARLIKEEIERELGITVSVGLSVTMVLAKVASKYRTGRPDHNPRPGHRLLPPGFARRGDVGDRTRDDALSPGNGGADGF